MVPRVVFPSDMFLLLLTLGFCHLPLSCSFADNNKPDMNSTLCDFLPQAPPDEQGHLRSGFQNSRQRSGVWTSKCRFCSLNGPLHLYRFLVHLKSLKNIAISSNLLSCQWSSNVVPVTFSLRHFPEQRHSEDVFLGMPIVLARVSAMSFVTLSLSILFLRSTGLHSSMAKCNCTFSTHGKYPIPLIRILTFKNGDVGMLCWFWCSCFLLPKEIPSHPSRCASKVSELTYTLLSSTSYSNICISDYMKQMRAT